MNNTIEILAPAGSIDSLKIAIDSGADAVYFGGSRFSARRNAVNLSDEEITEAVSYAHLRGARLYAAVNTVVFDSELADAFDFVTFLYESGVDGVIVQDLGLASVIKKHFPDMRIHASTQMTVHNLAGAIQAKKLGFDRVVLSRELSFEEIAYIAKNTDIELEVFVHGALCISYSGQCLFSSFLGGRSGNRGFCAQPCRLNYTLADFSGNDISEKNKYLLSLKDLCLIDYIDELKKAGVASFKIEGRMKGSAYVSAVTGMFHKYRDGKKVSDDDKKLLRDIFSRDGFTDGYFKSSCGRQMLNYDKSNDNIYDTATADVISSALDFASIGKKYSVDACFTAHVGSRARFEAVFEGNTFVAESDEPVVIASNKPVDSERVRSQLEKLGGTVLEYNSLTVNTDENIFISIKEINKMRRNVAGQIELHIIGEPPVYKGKPFTLIKSDVCKNDTCVNSASVLSEKQAEAAYNLGFDRIYIPYGLYMQNKSRYDSDGDVFVVKLPPINHDRLKPDFSDIKTDAVCITNIGQLGLIPSGCKVYSDYRLNVFNSITLKTLSGLGVSSVCLSAELTISQMNTLAKSFETEIVVYGKIALMTLKNCVVNSSLGKCGCKTDGLYYLKDRKNISFPLFADKSTCTNVIYNSAPVYMADRMKELRCISANSHRFDFTDESPGQMSEIVKMYESGAKCDFVFTRGHYYNGIL